MKISENPRNCEMTSFSNHRKTPIQSKEVEEKKPTNMADSKLFDEEFQVDRVDSTSFDRVSRVYGKSLNETIEFTLDVNTEIYPLAAKDRLNIVFATNVEESQHHESENTGVYDPNMRRRATLLDEFEYAMYGRVFKFEEGGKELVTMTASFGGLLLSLKAPFRSVEKFTMDLAVYLLISKR